MTVLTVPVFSVVPKARAAEAEAQEPPLQKEDKAEAEEVVAPKPVVPTLSAIFAAAPAPDDQDDEDNEVVVVEAPPAPAADAASAPAAVASSGVKRPVPAAASSSSKSNKKSKTTEQSKPVLGNILNFFAKKA